MTKWFKVAKVCRVEAAPGRKFMAPHRFAMLNAHRGEPVRAFVRIFLGVLLLTACTSRKPVPAGIQPEFQAINPSRILAVPSFTLPDPSSSAQVDLSLIETEKIIPELEKVILQSFRGQPRVNGVSFQAVRQGLGESPNALTKLKESVEKVSQKLTSTQESERLSLRKECLARKDFLEFYVHCLASDNSWVEGLNQLSSRILNADSALVSFLLEAEKKPLPTRGFSTDIRVAVTLVDTNSGRLIWGRIGSEKVTLQTPTSAGATAFDTIFKEEFWQGFPGRKEMRKP
jgi:hypothetical protein